LDISTVIGTLAHCMAADGCDVTFGTARRGLDMPRLGKKNV